ncbi:hypothetical protein ONS96_014269 [Cadophora gregata f. sp. sojae]|nr:hypothetical protein ONS96_014269 [Cadophora gregata f. sp. sojae]
MLTLEACNKRNILSDQKLKLFLGDDSMPDPLAPSTQVGVPVTKKDPICRFIFLWAGDSREPLKISRRMLLRILTYHQVMMHYLDFISVFGSQSEQRDLRFSGFKETSFLSSHHGGQEITSLGRSGRQYQLCFNLKGVSCLTPKEKVVKNKLWSIRQAALHHQFDVQTGNTLWMIAKGDLELKERIEVFTGPYGKPEDRAFGTVEECFKSSLAVHLLQCHWSTENWRWYIQCLEAVMESITHLAVNGARGLTEAQRIFTPHDLQAVQNCEDKTNEAIMVLQANSDVLNSLRRFYERLRDNKHFPLAAACHEDVVEFSMQIEDMVYDSNMQVARAKVLVQITEDRKTLILQHLQSQATETMEILTIKMHKIGALSQKEAIAMRIVTVVTLIYLPATFVSTFFSTDVVKYQTDNGRTSFSDLAMWRWLEVTLPLTVVTLGIGYAFVKYEEKRIRKMALLPTTNDLVKGLGP